MEVLAYLLIGFMVVGSLTLIGGMAWLGYVLLKDHIEDENRRHEYERDQREAEEAKNPPTG